PTADPAGGPAVTGEDAPTSQVPSNPGHATTAVRRRRALVEAAERRAEIGVAGGGPQMEELIRGQLAMEDVPADEPVVVLHLVRPDDLPVQDRAFEVRRQLGVKIDDAVRVCRQLGLVWLAGPGVRYPLGEHRHDVRALGRQGAVKG